MLNYPFYDSNKVENDWIDRNGHMNDAIYARVFSLAIDHFHDAIGLTTEARDLRDYTVFTIETHISYLKELKLHAPFHIKVQIYDFDAKRTHFFLELIHQETKAIMATAETMMMGMDRKTGRPAPYPDDIYQHIQHYAESQGHIVWPKQLGHRIGIPRS
ncbi:thioesterase family protein [Staphylococcus cornubiensis]|uniref:thioesterase family protein n=1 Tax=Staphylococcus cornubiensis TaxID=1986155 RepID=UPI000A398B2A|nr:thioesterase family protein [Staphylococcus cornubiensis]